MYLKIKPLLGEKIKLDIRDFLFAEQVIPYLEGNLNLDIQNDKSYSILPALKYGYADFRFLIKCPLNNYFLKNKAILEDRTASNTDFYLKKVKRERLCLGREYTENAINNFSKDLKSTRFYLLFFARRTFKEDNLIENPLLDPFSMEFMDSISNKYHGHRKRKLKAKENNQALDVKPLTNESDDMDTFIFYREKISELRHKNKEVNWKDILREYKINPKIKEFIISDLCITNTPEIWSKIHSYW